jgi:vitamin B12/bleomycin/antimicrobial peptide transport system ATP-binding/permease protein
MTADPSQPSRSEGPMLDRETVRRLRGAVLAFARSDAGGRAKGLGLLLLALLLGINGLNVVNSYVSRAFMTAIERREMSDFVRMAFLYVGVFGLLTATAVFYRFIEERLGLLWREWLTRRLVGVYLDDRTYYRLNAMGTLTNPDQRIADDVRSFTSSTLSLALVFLNGTFTIIAFSGVLWSISRTLFFAAVAYAVFGSTIAVLLGRRLVRLNYDQSDREADFRAQLIHVRENAESVALADGEPHVRSRLHGHVDALTGNLKRIVAVNRNLSFFTTGYDYLIQVIPVLIVAPLFIRGETEFGTIPQSAMAFTHVLGAFSLVVKQFPQLSTYAAVLARLTVLAGATETAAEKAHGEIEVVEDPTRFAFERLTLVSPNDGTTIVRDLSLDLGASARTLVRMANDAAAGALLRAVAGLREPGEGRIVRPGPGDLLLVSDRPYLPPGALRDLLGATGPAAAPDALVREELRALDLDRAVKRVGGLDVERDWDDVLSREERRLLALARVLLARPKVAVLARLEGSLGRERAGWLVERLASRGVRCLVVEDGPADPAAFDLVLEVAPDGSWSVGPPSPSGGPAPA